MNDNRIDICAHREDPFLRRNRIELEYAEYDRAILRLEILPEDRTSCGAVSSGLLTALMDSAVQTAVHSDGRKYQTRNCSITFPDSQPEGLVRAEAWVRRRDQASILAEADLTGQGGSLLAAGTYTLVYLKEEPNETFL